MRRLLAALVVVPLFGSVLASSSYSDGLIRKLPPPGHWASYDVVTSITHADGSQTNTTGTLVVKSLNQVKIDGKTRRWLEFELSWKQDPTDLMPQGFHSSLTKIAVDESVFDGKSDPTKGILRGYGAKVSSEHPVDK